MRIHLKVIILNGKEHAIISAVALPGNRRDGRTILATVNDGGTDHTVVRITQLEYDSARLCPFYQM